MSGRRFPALRMIVALLAGVGALVLASCDFPADPEGTLDGVQGGVLRVGLVHSPPWVDTDGSEFGGVEVELIRDFADELGAEIEWTEGTESELIAALEGFQLDLAAGGLTRTSPWSKEVALSRPFIDTEIVVALPPGSGDEVEASDLSGMEIHVRRGSRPAALLRQEEDDAEPVFFERLDEIDGPALIHTYEAEEIGFERTDYILADDEHAIAAPPGENAFIVQLDDFLLNNEQHAEDLLLEEVTR